MSTMAPSNEDCRGEKFFKCQRRGEKNFYCESCLFDAVIRTYYGRVRTKRILSGFVLEN